MTGEADAPAGAASGEAFTVVFPAEFAAASVTGALFSDDISAAHSSAEAAPANMGQGFFFFIFTCMR